ncbi:hypothetical protein TERTU_4378 [Teredinibacter turnerae T7901]|uniref:Uncharacterized protein n=1 Tax=Teredinibacter turnerae (strain ATCC 39867 / T7901) TaxID=377629 RepID=C5BIX8_TERTT|nr:hypothetical protein TERTU_4378 [Teredinibacter turnerae T7901]
MIFRNYRWCAIYRKGFRAGFSPLNLSNLIACHLAHFLLTTITASTFTGSNIHNTKRHKTHQITANQF